MLLVGKKSRPVFQIFDRLAGIVWFPSSWGSYLCIITLAWSWVDSSLTDSFVGIDISLIKLSGWLHISRAHSIAFSFPAHQIFSCPYKSCIYFMRTRQTHFITCSFSSSYYEVIYSISMIIFLLPGLVLFVEAAAEDISHFLLLCVILLYFLTVFCATLLWWLKIIIVQ